MPRTLPLALLALVLAACGDDDGQANNTSPDAGPDAALPDAAPDAAPPDAATGTGCRTGPVLDQTFAIDPGGPDTQIHPAARFDGESVWVTYNVPDASGLFDVWATRLDCDGTARLPPFRVNEAVDGNDVDPALDVRDGNLLVAWHSDNQTGVDNMDIVYRTYTVDGTPIMPADAILETTKGGVPVTGNAMVPQVAALPCGFAIAGIRGVPDATGWQVFVQVLDVDGALTSEAVDPAFEPAFSQVNPTLAYAGACDLYLAYERWPVEGDGAIVHTVIDAGPNPPLVAPPVVVTEGASGEYPVASSTGAGETFVVWSTDDGPVLADGEDLGGAAASLLLDVPLGVNHSPVVAARPGGGVVAWYLNLSGLRNELWLAPFAWDGDTFTQGTAARAFPAPVPPYPAAITWVGGSTYFLAWAEGQSPAFRVFGRFVQVE